ncbi:hypothetical protein [Streptosporangium amethystogenes]|nr:hypothetical protein [Streptosporangium amethystogenes]
MHVFARGDAARLAEPVARVDAGDLRIEVAERPGRLSRPGKTVLIP